MMTPSTVAFARASFFAANDFGADGGYDDPWSEAWFGPIPYRVPNPPLRAEALRVHDIHHVLTGYATDWRGESEISAWELGSGGPGATAYAWVVTLWGLFVGLLLLPRRSWRAFQRGRHSANLYGRPLPARVLTMPVATLRAELQRRPSGSHSDALAFVGWGGLALAFGLLLAPLTLGLVALGAMRVAGSCPLQCAWQTG